MAKNLVSKFMPLFNRVLIQRVAVETKTASGILLPESAQKALNEGTVVAVGPGGRAPDGSKIPMELKVGDNVLLPEYGGQKVKLGDDDFVLYQDNDILGVMSK
uniref:10 kDa chaperonin n=1 Tax=Lotharella oceanica TaxID=641309 RepID=A0A7S2X7K8_9EUKA